MRKTLLLSLTMSCLGDPPARVDQQSPDALPSSEDAEPIAESTVLHVLGAGVVDHFGRPWPHDAVPRRPVLYLDTSEPLLEATPLVFSGELDVDALLDDLTREPLLVAHREALLDADVRQEGARALVTPRHTLGLGSALHLALPRGVGSAAGTLLPTPFVTSFHVAASAAGAIVESTWPPAGAAAVPTSLDFAAVRFDDDVTFDGIGIHGVDTRATWVPCDAIGWPAGFCVRLDWDGALEPNREYRVVVPATVRDRAGAPVGPWESRFSTADAPLGLHLLPARCAPDEEAMGPGCALIDDTSVTLRLQVDGPVRAFLEAPEASVRQVAPRGEVALRLDGLPRGAIFEARLRLEGLGPESHHEALTVGTHADLARVTIAETRPDPRGPEPQQELVELVSFEPVTVSLEGFSLADHPDREGDRIEAEVRLPPFGRVLLVGAAFDPLREDDVPVPEGVRLIRLDASLASGGLSNAGEPLFLRDADGRRLSAAPLLPSPGPGRCWRRTDERSRAPEGFVAANCTPGTP